MLLRHSKLVICFVMLLYVGTAMAESFRTIEWTDLLPKADLDALLNPPEELADIEDGSIEDQIASQLEMAMGQASDSRYQQALVSTEIRPEFNKQKIRVPGFIVPLEYDDEMLITEFFLVPYFGACIHYPPPPPNQIIHVSYNKGIKLEVLYDPFWIEGTMFTEIKSNDMATSAYSMLASAIEIYDE